LGETHFGSSRLIAATVAGLLPLTFLEMKKLVEPDLYSKTMKTQLCLHFVGVHNYKEKNVDEVTVEQIINNYQAYVFWASKQILELEDEINILKNQERAINSD
jgi:hypothetical protein